MKQQIKQNMSVIENLLMLILINKQGNLLYLNMFSNISEMFTKALDMMNRAVSGHFQPGVKENIAYFTCNERRTFSDTNTPRSNSPATSIPQTAPFEVRHFHQ